MEIMVDNGDIMMQIKCLSNGSYSLKSCHNPFGKGFQPPAPYGEIPVEHLKSLRGASLRSVGHSSQKLLPKNDFWIFLHLYPLLNERV